MGVLVVLLVALKFRFAHAGSVCSGDFLEASEPPEGYLVEQGFFLKMQAFLMAALVVSITICGCFEAAVTGQRP